MNWKKGVLTSPILLLMIAYIIRLNVEIKTSDSAIEEIKFHTYISMEQKKDSTNTFNLEHAIKVHDNIHSKGNKELKWQGDIVDHRGGTLGAYVEAINILNEKDYRIYEVYEQIMKVHPELKSSKKEPYEFKDLNDLYNMTVTYDTPSKVSEVKKALQEGKLVQLQVHSNKWRNSKGELVDWKGYHTGLIFHFDGTYYHMKAAGKINQWDSIYTGDQIQDWIGGTHKDLIIYSKSNVSSPPPTDTPNSINQKMNIKVDDKTKQYQMTLNRFSQGCCFVGKSLIAVCDINVSTGGGDDNGTVCLYNRQTGKRYESSAIKRVANHSNSMTFDSKTNQLLIVTKGVDVYKVDLQKKIISEKTDHLNFKGHGIAYDPIKDTFALVYGNKISTYSREEFYEEKSPSKKSKYVYDPYDANRAIAQGLGSYEGLAFIPFTNKNSKGYYESNTIVVFDLEEGKTITELNIDYPHEIEECMCSENGDLYCSDAMGNLFKTKVNVYRDLGASKSKPIGGFQFALPHLPSIFNFITNFFGVRST